MPQDQYQYLPVNWMDGMKINKSHFISQNNASVYNTAYSVKSLLNNFNYGLLPNNNGDNAKIFVSADNQQQVQIRLQKFVAVTLGGYIIYFNGDDQAEKLFNAAIPNLSVPYSELKEKSFEYFVVITVNPYERIAYGNASPNETPLRLPYTLPTYGVELVPVSEARKNAFGDFQLPLAKVKIEEQKVILDENYIVPCCSLNSHNDLVEIHAALEEFFAKMELYSLQVIQKILQKKAG